LGATAVAFCVYRTAHFQLQPLDAPGTLHTILWPLYAAFLGQFPTREAAAENWGRVCFVAFLIPVALALLDHYGARGVFVWDGRLARVFRSRRLLFFSILLCLLVCRYPLLLGGDSNPDEAQFTASATKLTLDPVYFRAVDCNTSGPLNIYPLLLPALAGFSPDYASSRIVGVALIFFSIYFLYQAFRLMGEDGLARIAILPLVGFFGFVTNPDFVHYSSEHVSLPLIALAVYAAARTIRDPRSYARPLAGLGALVAASFFAKMQAVPIVGAVTLVAIVCVYRSGCSGRFWRPLLFLAAGFAPLPILNAGVCAAAGVWGDFWNAYLVANWAYTRDKTAFSSEIGRLSAFIADTREIRALIAVFLALLVASLWLTLRRKQRRGSAILRQCVLLVELGAASAAVIQALFCFQQADGSAGHTYWHTLGFLAAAAAVAFLVLTWQAAGVRLGWFGAVAGAALLGALAAQSAPRNAFPHYLLLLVIPLSTAMGWLLMRHSTDRSRAGAASLRVGPIVRQLRPCTRFSFTLVFATLVVGSAWVSIEELPSNFYSAQFRMAKPEGRLMRSLTRPGSTLLIWGWRPENYLDAGRAPAGRDTNMGHFFLHGKQVADAYRARFLRDLRQRPAELIVDALDVSCCFMNDRSVYGFETIPAIGAYIHSHYRLLTEQYGERFYLRRDLAVEANLP
jgi:hypothetical protein